MSHIKKLPSDPNPDLELIGTDELFMEIYRRTGSAVLFTESPGKQQNDNGSLCLYYHHGHLSEVIGLIQRCLNRLQQIDLDLGGKPEDLDLDDDGEGN